MYKKKVATVKLGGVSTNPMRNWPKVKSGGSAFRDASVPVNTSSRKVYSGYSTSSK